MAVVDRPTDVESIAGGDESPGPSEQELFHRHLPRLDAADFIDWDRDAGTITRGPDFEEIVPVIDFLREHTDEFSEARP